MKQQKLIATACAGFVLLASCGEPDETDAAGPGGPALQQLPPPPSPEVLVALKEQVFGSKLLGRTKYLVGDVYVGADLSKAPRYYLLNFSGSL